MFASARLLCRWLEIKQKKMRGRKSSSQALHCVCVRVWVFVFPFCPLYGFRCMSLMLHPGLILIYFEPDSFYIHAHTYTYRRWISLIHRDIRYSTVYVEQQNQAHTLLSIHKIDKKTFYLTLFGQSALSQDEPNRQHDKDLSAKVNTAFFMAAE